MVSVIETAYRSTLLEIVAHPKLIDNASDRAFRRFVEDMLQVLLVILSSRAESLGSFGGPLVLRRTLLTIIAELVRNAIPTSEPKHRSACYRRSLVLWSTLFEVMSELQGKELERRTQFWPLSLRRRFLSALEHRRRKRWPYNPYSSPPLDLTFKNHTLAAVFDMRATPRS